MKKKFLLGIGILLFAALALIVADCCVERTLNLNYIEQIQFQHDCLYYVDLGDDNYFRIIRSDTSGEQGAMITCKKHIKGKYRTIRQMFFDDQENMYVLVEETETDSFQQSSCNVYYCDFKEGELIKTDYDFSDIMRQNSQVDIECIRDGKVYYFAVSNVETQQGEVRLCTLDENLNEEHLDSIPLKYSFLEAQFFLSSNNIILWTDYDGEVSAKELGSASYLDIEGITGVKGSFMSLSDDGEYMAYVLDYEANCIRKINLKDMTSKVAYTAEEIQEQSPDFTFASLISLDCTETGFCAGVVGDKENSLVSICSYVNGKHQDMEKTTLTLGSVFRWIRSSALWTFLGCVLLGIYWYIYCKYQVETILIRIMLVFILVLVLADGFMETWIELTIREQLEKDQILTLSALGTQLNERLIDNIEKDPDSFPSGGKSLVLKRSSDKEQDGRSDTQELTVYVYSILKADENGNLRIRESMSEYSNVPVEWCYAQEDVQAIYTAYESRKSVDSSADNKSGNRNNRFIPIVLSDNTVYGVLSVEVTGNMLDYQIWYYQRVLKILTMLLLSVITVFLLLILFIFLRPLKNLKVCAGKLAAGEMGVTVKVRGHDEVANIGAAFNQMSLGLTRYINDIKEMSDGYYKFIPAKILELLGKDSISQVKLGDEISGNMTILSMHAIDYSKRKLTLSAEKVYANINQILSLLVAPISAHHGVVEHFEDAGLSALFVENSAEALDAAIEIHRSLDERAPGKGRSIAITYGRVMIGVIGHEERMETSAISAHSDLAKMLRLKGDKYGARILITHLIYQQIPDFERQYHARYLGNVYLSATDTMERIYDVYDGDTEEEFYYKELTKTLFEKGVNLFVAKKFYEARLVFVEVLKQHRKDRAAKEYLYRCDRYYKLVSTEDIDTVIERF